MYFGKPGSNGSRKAAVKMAAGLTGIVLGSLIMGLLTGLGVLGHQSCMDASSVSRISEADEFRRTASLLSDARQTEDVDKNSVFTAPSTVCAVDGSVIIRGQGMVGSSSDPTSGIHANGTVGLHGSAAAYGCVSATQTVLVGGRAAAGSIEEFASPVSLPQVPISNYSRQADEGIYWDGTCVIDDACSLGSMYVAGDLVICNEAEVDLCGTVYVEGDIRLAGGCNIEGSGVLVAEGDVTLCGDLLLSADSDRIVVSVDGNIRVTGNSCVVSTLCAPNGSVYLTGNCTVCGCVVGLSVTGAGSMSVEAFP